MLAECSIIICNGIESDINDYCYNVVSMPRNIEPLDSTASTPEAIPDRSDLSRIYERPFKEIASPITDTVVIKLPEVFRNGAGLSVAPAVIFTVYLYINNNEIDTFLFLFVPTLF